MAKLQLRSRFTKKKSSEAVETADDRASVSDAGYVSDLPVETIESAEEDDFSGNGHISEEEIISVSDEPEIIDNQEISEDFSLNTEDDINDVSLKPEPDIIVEESEVSDPDEKTEKKKKFGFKIGKKEKKPKKSSKKSDSVASIEEPEVQSSKPVKKKSKFNLDLNLNFGKKKKNLPETENNDDVASGEIQGQELTEESAVSSLVKKIEQIISPKPEIIEEMEFIVGEITIPAPGVPQKEVNITYEVTSGFQYVHIEFTGESLQYQCLEPPLSESEKEAMFIVQNAFDKMAHSEILLVEEEDRVEALRDRFDLIVDIYRLKLTETQKDKFFYYLHKKYMGFDRMDLLMKDPYIEDITCNGPFTPLYVNHRVYGSVATDVIYEEIELNNFVMRMAQAAGRHISVLEPIRDATLVDGSRANLTLGKEVTKRGSTFTIRRFRSNPVSCIDLMNYKTYDSTVLAYFWLMVEYKRSVLAAGGTASGKTTTLNALGAFIPPEYKIVSIEDTAEMNLMHPNWTQSITRAGFGGSSEGGKSAGDIELFDLLKAALRQRPEYIVVGEVRGAEAGTLFQAISVGHPCMGTIHAGSIQELLSRVESEPMNVPRNLFASVDMVIFNSMIKVGEHFLRRALRIVEIVELDPERGDLITNPVFKWNPITDEYEYSGSSAMFDDINDEFGIDQYELVREMDLRARYLEGLARDGITDYEDVARAIRRYSREKDELLEMTH
ncbi:ATPase, type IV secretory pathway VirB11 component like protein [Methanolobus tindarius DSM 2278]|uniref:ATPase, type IV secretory pathway VirB11 component like protein n=1 Tax=Methanolobus tindarius DSM 2278 TaxID=1090322 RepID=W9DZZ2_METTI|nr:type II/IV secretion system ATPase subunit [Methanolobus tindarius]ETA69262.1 ATPase, type IV secretory pathway VirB11 component like protein [Methanolobus tindarius DSM 2278]